MSKHVATAMSKFGGPCKDCGQHIAKGESVFKFPLEGVTTAKGNGPGKWVCLDCMVRTEGYVPSSETLEGVQETLL